MPSNRTLMCPNCKATAEASCDCGFGYVRAGDLAKEAVLDHPEMSNRAIAVDLGGVIDEATIRRARAAFAAPDTNPNNSNDLNDKNTTSAMPAQPKVTGIDGKSYPATKPQQPVAKTDTEEEKRIRKSLMTNIERSNKEVAAKLDVPSKMVAKVRKEIKEEEEKRRNWKPCRNTYASLTAISDELKRVKEDVENGASWWGEFDSYVEKTEEVIEQCKEIIDVLNSAIHNKNNTNATTTTHTQPHMSGNATLN